MKSLKILLLLILVLSTLSCGRKIVPATLESEADSFDEASFNYVYVEALKQKLMGNGGDALKYLEECVKINPGSDASYYQMAQILLATGDVSNGKKYAFKALSIDEENIWYLSMIAGLYYQEKNIDSAIIYYEKAVKYFPENENLQLALGNLYSENRNYARANSIFEAFDSKYGVNEKSTLAAIKNLIAEGKFDDALKKTLVLHEEFPDEIMYNGLLADIYKFKGDSLKALEVYNELLERNPENPEVQLSVSEFLLGEKSYADLFSMLNIIILNSKVERQDKIALVARIIEIPDLPGEWQNKLLVSLMVFEANYPGDNIIPLLRPELLIKQNNLPEAALRLEEVIKSYPDNYYAWEKLLIIYLQMKDYGRLFSKGEECATRFNTSYTAKLLYANGAIETGKYSVAIDELKKAEILSGDNKEFILQVLTMRADVYYRMKDYDKAFATFESALEINNEDLTVINNYAYYLAEQNTKLKEAEEMARSVVEKDRGNTTFLDTYGWVLYKRGKLQEAAEVMETIINSGEKPDAVWFEHYGYILKKENKCKEAIGSWNTALKLDSTKTELLKEIENCGK